MGHQANTWLSSVATRNGSLGTSSKTHSDTPPLRDAVSLDQFVSTQAPSVLAFFFSPGEYTIAITRLNAFLHGWTEIDVTVIPIASSSVGSSPLTISDLRSDKSTPRGFTIGKPSKLEMILTHRVTLRWHVEGSVHID